MMQMKDTLYPLQPNCVHEICGPGAVFFAISHAAQVQGTVFWIRQKWQKDQINPIGLVNCLAPERLLSVATRTHIETLAVAEEALRSGASPLVIMELTNQVDLTDGRRLQLAAQAGKAMGLALISEGAGSNAAQTRWHCRPLFDPKDSTLHQWKLIKNKSGTLGVWNVRLSASSRRVNVVPEVGK